MKTLFGAAVLCCFLGLAQASAADSVRVAGSRELRLAIVDSAKASPARDAAHAAFAAGLGDAVSQLCGSKIGVKAKCVNADHAAFNLGTGVYDAVLVISGTLPRALMISEVSRINATLGAGKTERKIYLIFGSGDATLAQLLAGSFEPALTNHKFLDALDGLEGKASAGGTVVAASP